MTISQPAELGLIQQLKREMLPVKVRPEERDSFPAFYERMLDWQIPAYQLPIIPDITADGPFEILFLGPPGHAKTMFLSTYAAWRLGCNPNLRVFVATHTVSYSIMVLQFIEQIIASPPFKQIFGNLIPKSGTARWTNVEKYLLRSNWRSKDPSLLALGAGSSTIGPRANLLLCDDLVTQQNSMTPTMRGHLANWYFGSLTKRVDPPRQILVVGGRFYAQDLYGRLKGLYKTHEFSATPEAPLWPEIYPAELLEQMRRESYVNFAAQYEQRPIDLESGFLKESDLHYYVVAPPGLRIYQGVDLCIKAKSEAKKPVKPNFFTITTLGVDINRVAYLLDFVQMHASRAQQKETIKIQGARWDPLLVTIETDGAQVYLYQELVEECNLPLNPVTSEGIPKALRLASMATHFHNKKVLLPGMINPDGTIGPAVAANDFIEAWRGYPRSPDDILDSTERALRGAFGLGVLPASGTAARAKETPLILRRELFNRGFGKPLFHSSIWSNQEEEKPEWI